MSASAENGVLLVGLSFAMFLGALLPGLLPLTCDLSPSRLKSVSVFGAGLLIGTALIVVVPEGVHMWYSMPAKEHEHSEGDAHHGSHEGGHRQDWLLGLSLALGFVFMVFVDRIGGSQGHGHSHAPVSADRDLEKEDDSGVGHARIEDVKSWSATFGLGVHAAVDGVALGSASVTNNGALSMIVFMAIMLHKGPATFGLASFLLNLGATAGSVRQTVLWFSCVAPVAALLTYFFLSLSGALSTQWVALLLVFSGGTFLYVSTVHILPEYASSAMKRRDVAVFVSGILFPLVPSLLDIGHGH